MASANPNGEKSEGPLFSTITSEKLNGKNYFEWSASVELWFLGQGHYDHLEKPLDEISDEKRDQWKKLDYQLCALLWQSVESDILANFRAFKTCHSFWKKAQSVFAYDTKRLYDSAQKLVTLKQSDHDMISYVAKAQSVVKELKIYLEADTLEEKKKKLDNLFMVLVLCGMHSDYEHVRDQILTSHELPSMENLFIRLLEVPSPKTGGNSKDCTESSVMGSNCGGQGGRGNCKGHGGGGSCPQCSCCKRMRHTGDTHYSLLGFPEKTVVHFRSLHKPNEDDFCLEMSRLYTYDDVVERVAQQLGLDDPSLISLTPHNCYSQQPKPQPIKYRGVEHLSDMLVHYNQTSDILYYEVLDIPLPEMQGLKTLKIEFHHATKDEVVIHTIRLPKQSTVGDILDDLKTKVELSDPEADLRLLEVFYHKIYKVFPPNQKIEHVNDQYWTLRAEEIPEEEKNLGPCDRLIHVYHFSMGTAQNQMQIQNFGKPLLFVIHEGETLSEIKKRIQKKLQVPDHEFVKWKFAFFSLGRPEYLPDSDIVSSHFQRRDVYGAWENYLGVEHTDNAPKRSYTVNQNRHC